VDDFIALNTNVFVLALRRDPRFPAWAALLFNHIDRLSVHVPLQVLKELRHNLTRSEPRRLLDALNLARDCTFDYSDGSQDRIAHWAALGAKKGDAVIAAQLEASHIGFLASENRHFLAEIDNLPFEVITSEQALPRTNRR